MNKSMKFVAVAALGLGVFQNFGVEAVKIISSDCSTEEPCANKADNDKTYILDNASRQRIMDAWNKDTDFRVSGSKIEGTVKINGEDVKLSFDEQKK
ncbi:MAG: hypothetical protein K2X28_05070 [Alphaproteobacteria bacterium]|nr:hypothetical protein [Alphaproteobacteria bacterium]